MDNVLLFFALKYQGNWEEIYAALEQKEKINHQELITIQGKIDCNFLTIINPLYPINLKNAHKPPFVLFVSGNLNLLGNYHQIIGVSGGEQFNEYGQSNTEKLVSDLIKENRIILTGDHLGIESIVIKKVCQQKGRLIIVTKKGIKDFCLENKELLSHLENEVDFLLISETYENQQVNQETNAYHSRLKVGLMKGLFLIQIATSDLNYNLNDGKDIFVVPEPLHSPFNGNNLLLKQGAKMVETVKDILNEI